MPTYKVKVELDWYSQSGSHLNSAFWEMTLQARSSKQAIRRAIERAERCHRERPLGRLTLEARVVQP